jgi:DNA-binding HxlR family transcriptional regulator
MLASRPAKEIGHDEETSQVLSLSDRVHALHARRLTERLHDLIDSGLVVRTRPGAGQSQECRLTPRGRQLTSILRHLDAWGVENAPSFEVQVGTPLTDLENERRAG